MELEALGPRGWGGGPVVSETFIKGLFLFK